jgi:hypothetical protein
LLDVISVVFSALDFLLILFVILKHRPHPIATVHALVVWAFIVGFETISTLMGVVTYEDTLTYLLVHVLLLTYFSVFLLCSVLVLPANGTETFLAAIQKLSTSSLLICISLWLSFRIHLLFKYGVGSFNLLAMRDFVGATYFEASLITFLWHVALGAFLAYVVKIGIEFRNILNPWLLLPNGAFFIFACLFNEIQSARRFLVLLCFLLGLVILYSQRDRLPSLRTIVIVTLLGIMTLGMAEYFMKIRKNAADNPEIVSLMSQGDVASIVEAGLQYLTPTDESSESFATADNLQERTSPFQTLYAITERQLLHLTVTKGDLATQSVLNVIPSAFAPYKETINGDHIIAEAFDLPDIDLATGILASMQSEISFLGYLVTPLIMALIIRLYSNGIVRTSSPSLRIVFLSYCVLTASYVEDLPDAILENFRDATVLIVVVIVFSYFIKVIRQAAKYFVRSRDSEDVLPSLFS